MARFKTYNETGVLTFDSAFRQLVVLGSGVASLRIVPFQQNRNPLHWASESVVPMAAGSVLRAFQGPYPAVSVYDGIGNAYIRGCCNDATRERIDVTYFDLGVPTRIVGAGVGLMMFTPNGELAFSTAQKAATLVPPSQLVGGRSYAAVPINSRLNLNTYPIQPISPLWTGCSAATMNGTQLSTRAPRDGQSMDYPWSEIAGLAYNQIRYVGNNNSVWVGPEATALILDVT